MTDLLVDEDWKPINGFNGRYEVSDLGRVRSTLWPDTIGRVVRGKILTNAHRVGGYLKIDLQWNGLTLVRALHVLVLETFVGPRPDGMHGCHNDGNIRNNILQNLRWDTPTSNKQDQVKHGTIAIGERHGRAKLTKDQIDAIRASGEGPAALARRLGVHRSTIHKIRSGEIWR